jgi:hypothetical protein
MVALSLAVDPSGQVGKRAEKLHAAQADVYVTARCARPSKGDLGRSLLRWRGGGASGIMGAHEGMGGVCGGVDRD